MSLSYIDKFKGMLIGGGIGDAIGELAAVHIAKESLQDWLDEGDTLRYTDDTAMSIGLSEALIEAQGVKEEIIGKKFQKNYAKEPWRSYSPSTPAIFAKVKRFQINYSGKPCLRLALLYLWVIIQPRYGQHSNFTYKLI